MARAEKRLVINSYASEGGRQSGNLSLDDPLASARQDLYAGRLRFTPGAVDEPDLGEQQKQQAAGNVSGGPAFKPSISGTPNITPFPLGCPPNFYQSGDVCIPMVGTFPDQTQFNAPAGYTVAKAAITQIIPPSFTQREQSFRVQVLFENRGGVVGKFFLRILIPSLHIDEESTGVTLPGFSTGSLWKLILMPSNAPSLQNIPAVAEVSHLDQVNGQGAKIVDDSQNFNIPAPGTQSTPTPVPGNCPTGQHLDVDGITCVPSTMPGPVPNPDPHGCTPGTRWSPCFQRCMPAGVLEPAPSDPRCVQPTPGPGPTPGPANDCFTITIPHLLAVISQYPGRMHIEHQEVLTAIIISKHLTLENTSIRFCNTGQTTMGPGCVKIDNKIYCPSSTHDENNNDTAAIVLNPSTRIPDNTTLRITGTGFAPSETVNTQIVMTAHLIDPHDTAHSSYEGKVLTVSHNTTSKTTGTIAIQMRVPAIPPGVKGHAVVTSTGSRSHKVATKTIEVT